MPAYYNEHDPKAAAWLRELIRCGHIAQGDVDERSIVDVRSDDLRGYTQCHFFAGIGVWSYALRLAGWPDDRPVWTGSCPCQPFSAAGKGEGYGDERHLWPHWYRLIGECRPPTIFGEQVDAAIRTGWLDDVCLSLESCGYAVGAVDFPACSVGAPHIRQRLYFVADASSQRQQERAVQLRQSEHEGATVFGEPAPIRRGDAGGVADAEHAERWPIGRPVEDECNGHDRGRPEAHGISGTRSEIRELADAGLPESERQREHGGRGLREQEATGFGEGCELGDAERDRYEGGGDDVLSGTRGRIEGREAMRSSGSSGAVGGFWRDAIWLPCRDGKARPTQSGVEPLAHGTPARVVRLRGYGNAIVAEQAKAFIEAYFG